jgi:serine/threonine protein kinase
MILHNRLASQEDVRRFSVEAQSAGGLMHPGIVKIHEVGQVAGQHYYTMEYIDGDNLADRLKRGPYDPEEAASLVAQVARAVHYLHQHGVIHRDLKPSNIMIERSGSVKVMDYGIARSQRLEAVTTTGSFLGTPHYAAPETVEAQAEPRSDIYSLGVVFFEMLTGSQPFRGNSAFEVLHNHCVTPPPTPSSLNYVLSKDLDRIVLRLLSKRPADRPTAEELLNELADYLRRADEAV